MTTLPSPVPAPAHGAKAPAITREIYGMPAFATLLCADVAATVRWYTEALDFISLFTIPGPDGSAVLVHLRRWQFQDLLLRPAIGVVTPGDGITLSFAAVYDELDALAERVSTAAGRPIGHVDTPWNTRDLTTTDPDGNVVIFTAGRPADAVDPAFSDAMAEWAGDQLAD